MEPTSSTTTPTVEYDTLREAVAVEADQIAVRIGKLQDDRRRINEEIRELRQREQEVTRVANAIKGRKRTKK